MHRLLEEGNIEGAEEQKQRIEQLQRERRKVLQENNMTHKPRFFKYVMFFMVVCYMLLFADIEHDISHFFCGINTCDLTMNQLFGSFCRNMQYLFMSLPPFF